MNKERNMLDRIRTFSKARAGYALESQSTESMVAIQIYLLMLIYDKLGSIDDSLVVIMQNTEKQ